MLHKISDFHTHTSYCDGKSTPTEMAERAYELGFTHLGFSGHGYTDFDQSYCMSREATEKYRLDIDRIKEEYEGKMCVLCGLEQDIYSTVPAKGFDYIIGSMHYIPYDGELLPIDSSKDKAKEIIGELFGGDFEQRQNIRRKKIRFMRIKDPFTVKNTSSNKMRKGKDNG